MKKKITISTMVTLIILTAAVTISVTMLVAMRLFNRQVQSVAQRQAMYTHIDDVDKKVREYYSDIDEERLRQCITEGYVNTSGTAMRPTSPLRNMWQSSSGWPARPMMWGWPCAKAPPAG